MSKISYKELFIKAKAYYFQIGSVNCKALNGEHIYFTREGFEHLIRKGRRLRTIPDQIRRFKLLVYAKDIIEKTHNIEIRDEGRNKFFALRETVDKKVITVVILQIGNGKKHFLSIVDNH